MSAHINIDKKGRAAFREKSEYFVKATQHHAWVYLFFNGVVHSGWNDSNGTTERHWY